MINKKFSKELQTAILAAENGAKIALGYFETDLMVEYKSDKSVVTKADRETEDEIKTTIKKAFPQAKFVAEESGGVPNDKEYWIIDPIDGTRSYTRGVPTWSILIALCRENEMALGVCYFPFYKTMQYAETGKGAYIDGKRIHVSTITTLSDSYMGIGSIRHFKDKERVLSFIDKAATIRSMESNYMNYLIARGNMDINIDSYANLWDIAPFISIISEAGGIVTNRKGEKYQPNDKGFIATNGHLHPTVVRLVNAPK